VTYCARAAFFLINFKSTSNGYKTMEDNFDDFLDQVDPINDIQVNTPI
jgi:hypothetical protein